MVKVAEFRKMREVIEHIPKKRDRVLIKTSARSISTTIH